MKRESATGEWQARSAEAGLILPLARRESKVSTSGSGRSPL